MENYIFELTLAKTDIKRTLSMPKHLSFYDLHRIIQLIFGWDDIHTHEFIVGTMPIAQSAKTCEYFIVRECEQKYDEDASLEIVLQGADSFTYEYDFNLFWKINIKILSDHDTEEDYPQLLKYEGKMARDDCHSIAELNKKYRYAVHQKLINDTLIGMFED